MKELIDFLNHGIFPFVGRSQELEHLLSFWRGTIDAIELRTALLIGEAGSGKSRLVEETIPRITEQGGIVVHIKIFPESDQSIPSLVARGLWYAEEGRHLLGNQPEEEIGAIVGSLRKLSRLRPTLLIVEDMHLLAGESAIEFSTLLNGLAQETLSLLGIARPANLETRSILQRFLIKEIKLSGLLLDDMAPLWKRLFGQLPAEEILKRLHEETNGNPMALRSALRWSVQSGTLTERSDGEWQLTISDHAFRQGLQQSVRLLAEGMIAHLTPEEKESAKDLAPLGEVFARETAESILGTSNQLLERLIYKGILSLSPVALSPLPGNESHHPLLVYTHTLLHQHLLSFPVSKPEDLFELIGEGYPLYSYLPFFLSVLTNGASSCSSTTLIKASKRIMKTVRQLDRSPDWRRAIELWQKGSSLVEQGRENLSEKEQMQLQVEVATWHLIIMRRESESKEFRELVDQYDTLLERYGEKIPPHYRLHALIFRHRTLFRNNYSASLKLWEKVQNVLIQYPELQITLVHFTYLQGVASAAEKNTDNQTLRKVEKEWYRLMDHPSLDEDYRTALQQAIGPYLLKLFRTKDELANRMELFDALDRITSKENVPYTLRKLTLLYDIGEMQQSLRVAREAIYRFSGVEPITTFQSEVIRLCASFALGEEPQRVADSLRSLCATASPELTERFHRLGAIYLGEMGILRGEIGWTVALITELSIDHLDYWPELPLLNALEHGNDLTAVLKILPDESEVEILRKDLAERLSKGVKQIDEMTATAITSFLEQPLLQIDDLLSLHGIIALLTNMKKQAKTLGQLEKNVQDAMDKALVWLSERSLSHLMSPLIELGRSFFNRKQLAERRSTIRRLTERMDKERANEGEYRIHICMLGTITVATSGKEPQGIRGVRQRTMLGLLVAAEIAENSLSNIEFCRIASGEEVDIDLARKTTTMAITRLRENYGSDFVKTGGETYRLNRTFVHVDLIEAVHGFRTAREALRKQALIRAVPAASHAFELLGTDVLFPGLYDSFFEALREDVEITIRSLLIDLASALLHEGDPRAAESLLRQGFKRTPDDEEIASLLQTCLRTTDNRADAERVRLTSESSLME